MNAVDFPPFQALLSHQPGMIMVTTVMVPSYDTQNRLERKYPPCPLTW
jgi:hypothetical protein